MGRIKIQQKGFTLLELLVTLSIFLIILAAVYVMYVVNQTTYTRGENKVEVQQNARVSLEMMAREIRMAGYDPSLAIPGQTSQTAIQDATANTLTVIADVTGDNVSDRVAYRLQGNQLIREISSWVAGAWTPTTPTSSVLADSVSALSFTYYDGSNTVTATLANIRRVTLQVTTQQTAAGMTERFPLTMDVRLRNLAS